jgi:hypothetical protein
VGEIITVHKESRGTDLLSEGTDGTQNIPYNMCLVFLCFSFNYSLVSVLQHLYLSVFRDLLKVDYLWIRMSSGR